MKPAVILSVMLLLAIATQGQQPATYQLKPTPKTVAYGYYDATTPPVLRIKSGDTVEVQTLIVSTPARLEAAGVKSDQIEQSLRDIVKEVTKGPGAHILTGPIFIEGAEPGDVLEVRIKTMKLAIPYAYNAFSPGRGYLPEDFPYARMRIIPLDEKRMVAEFADGVEIPLRPFFGSMGVAPPEVSGRINSGPPWVHAGNLDNKELVAGSTLFIPVHVRGALFLVGDGHAAQGNGEVSITALETSLIGTLQLIVRKDMKLKWPRAETSTHYITMGIHEDLNEATKMALREMIDFLVSVKHLTRDDAYMLSSAAADLNITQLVDGNKGVHAMIPKSIFTASQPKSGFITLERTVCFGSCPSYKVTITQDGTVTYEGRDFVKTKGTATAQIKPEEFNKLVNEFEKTKYFSLDDRYEPGAPGCPNAATDSPSARTSIHMNGKTKGVSHYYGCRDSEVLRALTALERKIDEIAGTERWIR
jgi:acetamidase/formamidase